MSEIPVEPMAFLETILDLMKKHNEIGSEFTITREAKLDFGRNLAKWIDATDLGLMVKQRDEAVKLAKMFIIGYYHGGRE